MNYACYACNTDACDMHEKCARMNMFDYYEKYDIFRRVSQCDATTKAKPSTKKSMFEKRRRMFSLRPMYSSTQNTNLYSCTFALSKNGQT